MVYDCNFILKIKIFIFFTIAN